MGRGAVAALVAQSRARNNTDLASGGGFLPIPAIHLAARATKKFTACCEPCCLLVTECYKCWYPNERGLGIQTFGPEGLSRLALVDH